MYLCKAWDVEIPSGGKSCNLPNCLLTRCDKCISTTKKKNQRHASPPQFGIACANITQFQLVQLGSTVRCPEDLHTTYALEIM